VVTGKLGYSVLFLCLSIVVAAAAVAAVKEDFSLVFGNSNLVSKSIIIR
jgi:hypothetical protein